MVRHSRKHHQVPISELPPPLHRTGGDEVVFGSEEQQRRGEGNVILSGISLGIF
jgi:hypothetical protein